MQPALHLQYRCSSFYFSSTMIKNKMVVCTCSLRGRCWCVAGGYGAHNGAT